MSRDECIFRKIECRFPVRSEDNNDPCALCLAGQQIDSIELLTSAIMDMQMNDTMKLAEHFEEIAKKYPKRDDMHEPN